MADPEPKPDPAPKRPRGRHKTHAPALTAEDVKFAQLLFAARCRPGERESVVRCYLEAGFPARPTDEATRCAAYRRAKNRHFRDFYRLVQDAASVAARVNPELVTRMLMWIATFDLRQVFDPRGRIKLPHEWSDAVAAGVLAVESEELFDYETEVDPETGKKSRRKVLVGYARKVKRVTPTEAIKMLAQITRLIGQDSDAAKAPPSPLVIGGDADPNAL